jgi:hypothetical protein
VNKSSILIKSLACAGLALGGGAAHAYVGPGAGLSLLGALWGLLIAVGVAVGFVVLWPLRQYRRRRRHERDAAAGRANHPATEWEPQRTPARPAEPERRPTS